MSPEIQQGRLFAEDAPGLALQLDAAAKALGYCTLALGAGEVERARMHVRQALHAIVTAQAGLPIGGADR